MIVSRHKSWIELFFSRKGAVLNRIGVRLLAATGFALIVTLLLDYEVIPKAFTVKLVPFSLVGLPLSIFLGFRNNSSYDRFWEGRKLWGQLINTTRTLTRQVMLFVEPERAGISHDEAVSLHVEFRKEMVYRLIAYLHALRHYLRDETDFEDCRALLCTQEFEQLFDDPNPPIGILHRMGERFREAWDQEWVDTFHLPELEHTLRTLTDIQGGCERIKKTPIPFAYTVLMHRLVGIYCFALPFGIYGEIGDLTPVAVFMVSYSFFGLDAIGDELEEPFGKDANDLPLSAFCNMLEIECRTRLGETELPERLGPVDDVLT